MTHHGDDWGAQLQIAGTLLADFFFLDNLLFEGDHLDDAVERFGEVRGSGHVQRLIDAGENAAIEQDFQQILGADIELFGELADGDAFRDGHGTRLALNGSDWLGDGGPARARTGARANGVELALTFGEAFFNQRAAARGGRLARVKR